MRSGLFLAIDLMNLAVHPQVQLMNAAQRCSATSKRSGLPCGAPATKVCRCHGARGGAPKGSLNGRWGAGLHSAEVRAERSALADLSKECRATLRSVGR